VVRAQVPGALARDLHSDQRARGRGDSVQLRQARDADAEPTMRRVDLDDGLARGLVVDPSGAVAGDALIDLLELREHLRGQDLVDAGLAADYEVFALLARVGRELFQEHE